MKGIRQQHQSELSIVGFVCAAAAAQPLPVDVSEQPDLAKSDLPKVTEDTTPTKATAQDALAQELAKAATTGKATSSLPDLADDLLDDEDDTPQSTIKRIVEDLTFMKAVREHMATEEAEKKKAAEQKAAEQAKEGGQQAKEGGEQAKEGGEQAKEGGEQAKEGGEQANSTAQMDDFLADWWKGMLQQAEEDLKQAVGSLTDTERSDIMDAKFVAENQSIASEIDELRAMITKPKPASPPVEEVVADPKETQEVPVAAAA